MGKEPFNFSSKTDRELLIMTKEYLEYAEDDGYFGKNGQVYECRALIDEIQARIEVEDSIKHFG